MISPSKAALQSWKNQGITYIPPTGEKNNHALGIPIHDLNDIFFANFMQQIYENTDQAQVFIEVRKLYFKIPGDKLDFTNAIKHTDTSKVQIKVGKQTKKIDVPLFPAEKIQKLIAKATELSSQGMHYGYVTVFTQPKHADNASGLDPNNGHLENIDVRKLAELNLNNLPLRAKMGLSSVQDGKFCIIGDRNWVEDDGYPNYLGIAKTKVDLMQPVKTKRKRDEDEPSKKQEMYFFETVAYISEKNSYIACDPYQGWIGFHKSELDSE